MKDIKNQFFIAASLPFGGVFQKDLTRIQQVIFLGEGTVPREYNYYRESKYNEDFYPTETIESFKEGSSLIRTTKYLFTYKKVVL
ncbi:hypothetical protein D3C78_1585730 [compost metagenome]